MFELHSNKCSSKKSGFIDFNMVGRKHYKIKRVFGLVLLSTIGVVLMKHTTAYVDMFPYSIEEINTSLDDFRLKSTKAPERTLYTEQTLAKKIPFNSADTMQINDNSTHYVCTGLGGGRLGNTLYMFASSYGIARSKGMKLSIPEGSEELESNFHLKGTFYKNKVACDHVKTIPASGCCKFDQNIINLPNNKSFRVSNYLQSYKYFERYRDEVRSILTFSDEVIKSATFKLESLLSKTYGGEIKRNSFNRTLVGIHIRRGDYLLKDKQKFGYKVATKEYIHSAMDTMRKKYPNITFIVCSMDLRWARTVLSGMIDVIIAPVGSSIIDMALLSIMDHIIITVGTYGFWSAWLNKHNGTVIYYKDFIVPNSRYAQGFTFPNTDTYYPYWIGM